MPKPHNSPNMPAVAMSTAKLRATDRRRAALRSSVRGSSSSSSTSWHVARAAALRPMPPRGPRSTSCSSGVTSFPTLAGPTSWCSRNMHCISLS
eukprot:CAMPEP_0172844036 /NCGR_PEP_ID=MMETSP1075-20121228/31913_1 /TAXON_ID=2916 /ORGANISM="Ceratium fusus, Strain PA161109" /LENGTH=93 /DNA_ID=CAMNT_0013688407 /DNA_START=95 /DNA_END=372 /DNA_ORIENTATION=-